MEKEDIKISDLQRILFGETPPVFLIEIVIRAIILYALLMIALRLMGKRMALRLTRNELAAIATIGAAIGMPVQTPGRGLLPAVLIVALVVTIQRIMAWRAANNPSFEKKFIGRISTVLADGVLNVKELRKANISRDRVLSELRTSSLHHLGEIKRVYLESTGSFTIVKEEEKHPGLSVLPQWDKEFVQEHTVLQDHPLCTYCGKMAGPSFKECSNCGNDNVTPAIL